MSDVRTVLDTMEATFEGGKTMTSSGFVGLGMDPNDEPEFFKPPAGWDDATRGLFHYVRGNYCLFRLSDSYLNRGIDDFIAAFPALLAAKDAARATRAFARVLRQFAYASYSLPSVFERADAMFQQLAWMRANAPRRDVEELDLSLVEMLSRMVREGAFNDRDAIVKGYGLVRATLSRLFEQSLTRQRAIPHATAGFWLGIEQLWTDADLAEPREWYGESGGREELRRAAYFKACELEDGSFYRVGSATPNRKQRELAIHFVNLVTQHATLRDDAGRAEAIARWGRELGKEAVDAALAEAEQNATPPPEPAPAETAAAQKPKARATKPSTAEKSKAAPSRAKSTTSKKTANAPAKNKSATAKTKAKPAAKKPAAPARKAGAKKRR